MLPMGPDTRILLTASRHSSAVFDDPMYLHTSHGLITSSHVSRVSPPRHVGHDEVAVQQLAGGGALLGGLHQAPRHEVDKLLAPSVGRKLNDKILYDLRPNLCLWLPLRHLQRGDAQAPDVSHAVVADLLDQRSVLCGQMRGLYYCHYMDQ